MLHELFMALVGFTGDVIVEDENTFKVKNSYGVFTQSEIDQLSKIVPIGWTYKQLQSFVNRHELQWTISSSSAGNQAYLMAMSNGISDILNDYVNDVTFLEQMVSLDGPIPLSEVFQQLQKYILILPVLHNICKDTSTIRGCQILEYLSNFRSGVPVLMCAIENILARVNIVFFRQSIGWMIYGQLDDPLEEYFIRLRENSFKSDSNYSEKSSVSWNKKYILQLNFIPTSHITANQANKIYFAGKVANLLNNFQSVTSDLGNHSKYDSEYHRSDLYYYLSKSQLGLDDPQIQEECNSSSSSKSLSSASHKKNNDNKKFKENIDRLNGQFQLFSPEDFKMYSLQFENILRSKTSHRAVVSFKQLVDDIHAKVSDALWIILCQNNVKSFFHYFRNMFLLGKGEFYQNILDELVNLTLRPTPDPNFINSILKWNVLKSSCKKLNLDEEILSHMISLTVNTQDVVITDFFRQAAEYLSFVQNTRIQLVSTQSSHVQSCSLSCVSMCFDNPQSDSKKKWENSIFNSVIESAKYRNIEDSKESDIGLKNVSSTVNSHIQETSTNNKIRGMFWLNEIKSFSEGFTLSLSFKCNNWTTVFSNLTSNNLVFESKTNTSVCLSELKVLLVDDKSNFLAVSTANTGITAKGSLYVSISFNASITNHSETSNSSVSIEQPNIAYYVKLSVCVLNAIDGQTSFLNEKKIPVYNSISCTDAKEANSNNLNTDNIMYLDVEYLKSATDSSFASNKLNNSIYDANDTQSLISSSSYISTLNNTMYPKHTGVLRARISNQQIKGAISSNENAQLFLKTLTLTSPGTINEEDSSQWDVSLSIELSSVFTRQSMGKGHIGIETTSLSMNSSSNTIDTSIEINTNSEQTLNNWNLNYDIYTFEYKENSPLIGSSNSISVVSPFTKSNHVDTFVKLTSDVIRFQVWLKLKLQIRMPNLLFTAIFDDDVMSMYEGLFSNLIKIRLISHSLERLWHHSIVKQAASVGSSQNRFMDHIRQIMHFFISNLLYYLQVDVVDSEFCEFLKTVESIDNEPNKQVSSNNFQKVYKSHREFLVAVTRLSFIDNASICDVIDKILLICIRFITLCRLKLMQDEQLLSPNSNSLSEEGREIPKMNHNGALKPDNTSTVPVIIPMEEIMAIKKDFLKRVEYLFKIVNKLESQRFLFRLDFNGYFTNLFNEF